MFLVKCLYLLITIFSFRSVWAHDRTAPVPTSYEIIIRPDMSNMIFEGEVLIGVRTVKHESEIRLNSQGLDITSVNVKWAGQMSVIESHSIDHEHELLKIKLDNLFAGNHTIKVTFKGQINDRGVGFFASTCRSQDVRSWIAGAILQPVNARAVFPSFDLNENKVPVKLELILNQEFNAVTPILGTTSQLEGLQDIELNFDEVHLEQLGWAFYPNDNKVMKKVSENGHTAITCRDNNWTTITYDIAEEMSNYTNTEVKGTQWIIMPDLPTPFASSENMIFIREHLFENSTFTTQMEFKENLLKVNEAYAQQLFGQTIRVHWWPHIWLTKGLANFMSYKLTEKVNSKFRSDSYIIGNVLPRVLERESIPHSMSRSAHSKQEVLSMYDQDLFDRAGLIMRMIEDKIGENSFRRTVMNFVIKTIGNGSANPTHFWDSLKENSLDFPEDKTVEETLNAWINSSGYPVVNVKRDKHHLFITQERILKEDSRSVPGYWWIPITVTSQSLRGPRKFWLRPRGTLRVNIPLNDNWYMINENGKGFYRVNYDLENWKNLSEAITSKELNGMARARLLDDSLGLAETDHLHYSIPLQFTKHLADEYNGCPRFMPWTAAVRHLVTIRTLLRESDKPFFNEYVSTLIELYLFGDYASADKAQVAILNATSENINLNVNSTVMDTMLTKLHQIKDLCRNNPYCYNIIKYFTTITTDDNYSSEAMLDVIQCFNVENNSNNEAVIDDWLSMYKQYTSATAEMKIMKSLSCLKNAKQRYRLLDAFLNETSDLKRQDFVNFIVEMSYSEESVHDILNWMTTNKLQVYKYISGDISMVSNIVLSLSEKIYDENKRSDLKEILATFEKNNLLSSQLDRQQIHRAMFRIEKNIHRRKKHSDDIKSWLKGRDHVESFLSSASTNENIILLTLLSLICIKLRYMIE